MLIEDHFLDNESSGEESKKALEKLYTHTLYYLAQAYKKLGMIYWNLSLFGRLIYLIFPRETVFSALYKALHPMNDI